MFKKKPAILEISPEELKSKLDKGENMTLIDVREPDEYEICRLEKAKLIPMRQIPERLGDLNPDELTVLYCHHGIRSAQATVWLRRNGFIQVVSLRGGIDEWAQKIDPEMDRY